LVVVRGRVRGFGGKGGVRIRVRSRVKFRVRATVRVKG
jgi:hypothetical protein